MTFDEYWKSDASAKVRFAYAMEETAEDSFRTIYEAGAASGQERAEKAETSRDEYRDICLKQHERTVAAVEAIQRAEKAEARVKELEEEGAGWALLTRAELAERALTVEKARCADQTRWKQEAQDRAGKAESERDAARAQVASCRGEFQRLWQTVYDYAKRHCWDEAEDRTRDGVGKIWDALMHAHAFIPSTTPKGKP